MHIKDRHPSWAKTLRGTRTNEVTLMHGMMWGMALIWLALVVVLLLAVAALVKYLSSGRK